jgi:hypothetical protein
MLGGMQRGGSWWCASAFGVVVLVVWFGLLSPLFSIYLFYFRSISYTLFYFCIGLNFYFLLFIYIYFVIKKILKKSSKDN